MKSWTDPASSFHIPENVEVFSNPTLYPTSITMSSITPNRTKANHHWLNHVQILNTQNYATSLTVGLTENFQIPALIKEILNSHPLLIPLINTRTIMTGWLEAPLALRDI